MTAEGASRDVGVELASSLRAWLSTTDIAQRADFDRDAWTRLGSSGALGVSAPVAGGDAIVGTLVAEELGRHLVGGPIVAATLGAHLLPFKEAGDVVAGTLVATYGVDGRFPWGESADVLLDVSGGGVRRVAIVGRPELVDTMAGDPWLLADMRVLEHFDNTDEAVAHAELVLAAYLVGATTELLRRAADHARDRRQFGHPIGDFQAVAHPLAESFAQASASSALNHAVAGRLASGVHASSDTGLALLAATRTAVQSARVVHQVFGALGFSVESGVARFTNRLRQWSLVDPSSGTGRARIARAVHEQSIERSTT